jgi:hypothetical protein
VGGMWQLLRMHLLPNDRIQLCHGDLLGPIHGRRHLLLVLLRQKRQYLSDNGVETLRDLRLFVHFHVQSIRHLVIHYVMPLNFDFLTRQLFALQLKVVVLCLKEVEFFLNAVT